ncbi:MAG TPA: phosphotransferase [Stellaceae bacterium]|nr:phosphotransferase [Stellaceae bacterium]
MADRPVLIDRFLATHGWRDAARTSLAMDASFRHYMRISKGEDRAILMDAPPPQEDVRPFIAIQTLLRGLELSAPALYAADIETGLLLLEDFGDGTYTRLLAAGAAEEPLYALAVDVLIALHRRFDAMSPPDLPRYDEARLLDEAVRFVDWYLRLLTGKDAPAALRDDYLARWRSVLPLAAGAPQTLVLRDYHVDNLMRLDGRGGVAACGLLDFQDAVLGAATYDLMSLLEDERRDVALPLRRKMIARYLAAFPALDRNGFTTSYAVMGAQRHAKNIGQFARLKLRDGKPHYLKHIPHMWRLLIEDLAHPALSPVREWFETNVPPDWRRVPESARA